MRSLRLIALHDRIGLAALEHAQHAVGDQEAADHVDGAEGDGDDQQDVLEQAVGGTDEQQATEHDDAVDGVRARHEGRVQRFRNLRDDLEPDERREDEDGQFGEQIHQAAAFFAPSWTISPPRVMHAPAMTSSSKSRFSAPSSPVISSTSESTLRAYREEACSAMVDGRLGGAAMITPPSVV